MKYIFLSFSLIFLFVQKAECQKVPELYGFHSSELIDLVKLASSPNVNVHSMHVSRSDSVFFELYSAPFNNEMIHDIASVTKSVISLFTWKAVSDSIIPSIDVQALELLPEKYIGKNDPDQLEEITVRNLLDMRSGWNCGLNGSEAELSNMRTTSDWVESAISMDFNSSPGSEFSYCSPNFHVLAAILDYQTKDLIEYARTHLFDPLGIEYFYWPVDPQGVPHGWGDLSLMPSDMVKIGRLMENEGLWNQQRLLPANLFKEIEEYMGTERYRIGFWFSESEYEANGRGGQRITILPSLDVVIVMTGGGFEPGILGDKLGQAFSGLDEIDPEPEDFLKLTEEVKNLGKITHYSLRDGSFDLFNGEEHRFEENELGLKKLQLKNINSDLIVNLTLADGTFIEHPFHRDGGLSIVNNNRFGQAARILQASDLQVKFEFNTLSRINIYEFILSTSGKEVKLKVTDLTNNVVYNLTAL